MEQTQFEVCQICKTLMADSRILQCAHSFCLKCLESSITSKVSPRCPTCQIEFQIPEGGLKDLKKNEFIEQLNVLKRNIIICDSCNANQAIKFCVDCSFSYCSICLVPHAKIPTLSNHQLQSTAPTSTNINVKKYSSCKDHSDLMNLFCEDCKVVVCGLCMVLNHNNHPVKHLSQYFESVKTNIEENLKSSEEIVKYVVANQNSNQAIMQNNEVKVSALKNEIQERGEYLKKVVDSVVDELLTNVDKEWKRIQQLTDVDVKELKDMETNLNLHIETLKQHLNNLNYETMFKSTSNVVNKNEFTTKICQEFKVSFISGINQPILKLKRTFGTLKKAPSLLQIHERKLSLPYKSFALKENCIYLCGQKTSVDVYDYCNCILNKSYDFKDKLSQILDILLINNMMYVAGKIGKNKKNNGILTIFKTDILSNNPPMQIYSAEIKIDVVRLSKSHDDNILLSLAMSIIHLSENGDVLKTIYTLCSCNDVLQLDERLYAVTCEKHIFLLDDRGLEIKRCSSLSLDKPSPTYLAKDNYGNLYVGDKVTQCVYVFDFDLKYLSCCSVGNRIIKMHFDEARDLLTILTDTTITNHEL